MAKTQSKYSKESIQSLLMTNDVAVGRALLVLFNRQTAAEKAAAGTFVYNGVGFTGADGHYGVRNAKFYIARGELTAFQLAYWRKPNRRGVARIGKYWQQLIDAAEQRDTERAASQAT